MNGKTRKKVHHRKYGALHRPGTFMRRPAGPDCKLLGEVPVTAKCPTCGAMHTVMLPAEAVEPGKLQRIFCRRHEHNRAFDGLIYQMTGVGRTRGPRRGAQA